MSSKLYVSNLSSSATLSSLRQHFGGAGEVLEVEFAAERNSGSRQPSSAFVTMASSSAADEAVRKLHGRLFLDRSLMVNLAPGSDADGRERERERKAKPTSPGVTVSQQYRERGGMAYELDCSGVRLTLRFFFADTEPGDAQRVEARTGLDDGFVVQATAATRALALQAVAEAWRALPSTPAAPQLDWELVSAALKTVRVV